MGLFSDEHRTHPAKRVPALTPLMMSIGFDPRIAFPRLAAQLRGQWDLRADAIDAFVDLYLRKQPYENQGRFIDMLVAQDPPLYMLVRAAACLMAVPNNVGQAQAFAYYIEAARRDAQAVLSIDAYDPTPCAYLVDVARHTGDRALARAMHDEGKRRARFFHRLEQATCEMLSPRWGGDHGQQLAHALAAAAQAPDGNLDAGLAVHALFSNLTDLDVQSGQREAFARRPDVLPHLHHAAQRSVDSFAHTLSCATFELRTKAGIVGALGGDTNFARHQFRLVGDVFVPHVWTRFHPDPTAAFAQYRLQLGR